MVLREFMGPALAAIAAAAALAGCASAPAPVTVPFEPHANQVTLSLEVDRKPLKFLLDTALDPSAVDRSWAQPLDLPRASADEAVEGVGQDAARAYESRLPPFRLGGRTFGPVEVAVIDLAKLQARFGAQMDGILGYSFLKDHPVVIDYVADRVSVYRPEALANDGVRGCRKAHRLPIRFVSDEDRIIQVDGLTIAGHAVPAMLDTGSSNGLRINVEAPELAPVRPYLPAGEAGTSVGARGEAPLRRGVLEAPVTLGPFRAESMPVALVDDLRDLPPVNIGNQFLRAMKMRLLVDIPHGAVGFYGDCG